MNPVPSTPTSPAVAPSRRRFVRLIPSVLRVLMGAAFVVFGLNGFFNFLPQPSTPLPAPAVAFITALMKSGYMLQLIATTQLLAGILLVANRFVPLALALLAPFFVNSIAFHVFLEPTGRPMAFVFSAIELYLAWCYRASFRPMLASRASPGAES